MIVTILQSSIEGVCTRLYEEVLAQNFSVTEACSVLHIHASLSQGGLSRTSALYIGRGRSLAEGFQQAIFSDEHIRDTNLLKKKTQKLLHPLTRACKGITLPAEALASVNVCR